MGCGCSSFLRVGAGTGGRRTHVQDGAVHRDAGQGLVHARRIRAEAHEVGECADAVRVRRQQVGFAGVQAARSVHELHREVGGKPLPQRQPAARGQAAGRGRLGLEGVGWAGGAVRQRGGGSIGWSPGVGRAVKPGGLQEGGGGGSSAACPGVQPAHLRRGAGPPGDSGRLASMMKMYSRYLTAAVRAGGWAQCRHMIWDAAAGQCACRNTRHSRAQRQRHQPPPKYHQAQAARPCQEGPDDARTE